MPSLKSSRGSTLVEVLVASVLIGLIGLLISRSLVTAPKMLGSQRDREKAAALGQMVFEDYEALAQQDSVTLSDFNQIFVTPREFFKSADDLGYDGMRITTAGTRSARGSVEVAVTISWGVPPAISSMTMTKLFLDGALTASKGASGSGL